MNNGSRERRPNASRKDREFPDRADHLNAPPDSDVSSQEKTREHDARNDGVSDAQALIYEGKQIGPYKLLEQIGEGGFGVVYAAEQKQPIRRKVALKIIKPGMDTKNVIARFEAERQALALMDHVNIARVLDAGATESGHPYFVMDLVHGVPITEYCDQRKLNIRQRLELFVSICQAVQHAHQKGIIHRDIKPNNVLVELKNEETGVPKIIDFGVAKATNQQLTEHTIHTLQAQMIGTPMYMSPEQAAKSGLDVDTRTDIYSLGVLLYEILTGTTPIDKQRLLSVNPFQLIEIICHEEPTTPSTKIDESDNTASSVSAHRRTDPGKLQQMLRGDLDWIVLKALEKDRTRRYDTASDFAADVRRYLDDEPVVASPPTARYRLRKFARRNKVAFATVALVSTALLLGSVVSTTMAIFAMRSESRAKEHHESELKAIADAASAEHRAKKAEHEAEQGLLRSYSSLLFQAQANRMSGLVGQRLESLRALTEAAKLRIELGLGDDELLKLRNEAIACMGLIDLKEIQRFELPNSGYWVAFDPQLSRYAFLNSTGDIAISRIDDEQQIVTLTLGATDDFSKRFSPNGRYLATHHPPGRVRVWDLKNKKNVLDVKTVSRSISITAHYVYSFSMDGVSLATVSADGSIHLFDVSTGKQSQSLPTNARTLALRPDGRQVAISHKDQPRAEIWDVETQSLVHTLPHPYDRPTSLVWSANGKLLACGVEATNKIHIWDALNGSHNCELRGHMNGGIECRFSNNSKILATCSWDRTTRLWDPIGGNQLVRADGGNDRFGPEDRFLAFKYGDGGGIWDVIDNPECRMLSTSRLPNSNLKSAAFFLDNRLIAYAGKRGIYFCDVVTGEQITDAPIGGNTEVVRYHRPTTSLICNSQTGLYRWPIQVKSDRKVCRIGPPVKLSNSQNVGANSYVVQPEGLTVAVKMNPHTAKVFRMDTPNDDAIFKHPDIECLAISPDGRWVASGTRHGHGVKIWNAQTEETKNIWPECMGATVAFSPDGNRLVASDGSEFRSWKVGEWNEGQVFAELDSAKGCRPLAFSHDASLMAVCQGERLPKLIDANNGAEIATLRSPIDVGNIESFCFSSDNTHLAIVYRHSVHVWNLRLVRQQLSRMNLDWNLPSFSALVGTPSYEPIEIDLIPGSFAVEAHRTPIWKHIWTGRFPEAIQGAIKSLKLLSESMMRQRIP